MNFAQELIQGPMNRAVNVFRYSSHPVIRQESVAEHSYYVALYSLMISLRYELNVDTGRLLTRALIHDVDEGLTGDFVRSFKYSSPELKLALDEHARKFAHRMIDFYTLSASNRSSLYNCWDDAKDTTIEGEVIATADFVCVVVYSITERMTGNLHMVRIFKELLVYADTLLKTLHLSTLQGLVLDLKKELEALL